MAVSVTGDELKPYVFGLGDLIRILLSLLFAPALVACALIFGG